MKLLNLRLIMHLVVHIPHALDDAQNDRDDQDEGDYTRNRDSGDQVGLAIRPDEEGFKVGVPIAVYSILKLEVCRRETVVPGTHQDDGLHTHVNRYQLSSLDGHVVKHLGDRGISAAVSAEYLHVHIEELAEEDFKVRAVSPFVKFGLDMIVARKVRPLVGNRHIGRETADRHSLVIPICSELKVVHPAAGRIGGAAAVGVGEIAALGAGRRARNVGAVDAILRGVSFRAAPLYISCRIVAVPGSCQALDACSTILGYIFGKGLQ